MSKSTRPHRKGKAVKPAKPRPDFPLYAHGSGKWAKTIRGKTYYFGRWDDPQGALQEYLDVKDDLHAGRTPRSRGGLDLRELCNAFIPSKQIDLETDRLSPRTFGDYDRVCRLLLDEFGPGRTVIDLRPADFERLYAKLARKHGVASLGTQITMCRSVFKYAYDMDLIDRPIKFGPKFKVPSRQDRRKAKAKARKANGNKLFSAEEIRSMIDAASPQLKAMILLGVNGGMGNSDCAGLPLSALDLDGGWLDYPRVKTGVQRRIPLWPETVETLRQAIAKRRKPQDAADADLVFITKYGQKWVRCEISRPKMFGKVRIKMRQDDAIAKAFGKLLVELGLKRPGVGFYALRHTFETVAGGSRDQVAVDSMMGHVDNSMAGEYRHGIEDDRLRAVVDHVRNWLLGSDKGRRGDE